MVFIVEFIFLFFCVFLVVGEKEQQNGTVNVRTRDNKVRGERSIEKVKSLFKELSDKRILNSEEFGFDQEPPTEKLDEMKVE